MIKRFYENSQQPFKTAFTKTLPNRCLQGPKHGSGQLVVTEQNKYRTLGDTSLTSCVHEGLEIIFYGCYLSVIFYETKVRVI